MDVERRSLLKGLAAGFTGAAVTPAPADARVPTLSSGPETEQTLPSPSTTATAGLLDDHQRRTLASLADLILPGSVAAGTVERIDRVAAVNSAAQQRRLLNAIACFDLEARGASVGNWLDLPDATRLEILTRAATAPSGQPVAPVWTRDQPVVPTVTPEGPSTLRDHLDFLKATIGAAFASTEAGMKALGWTGRSSWGELPGCTQSDAFK